MTEKKKKRVNKANATINRSITDVHEQMVSFGIYHNLDVGTDLCTVAQ